MTGNKLRAQGVVRWLADEGLETVTAHGVVRQFGVRLGLAHAVLARMAAANQLYRVKRGLYIPLPPSYWGRRGAPVITDWYKVAKHLAAPDAYFLAYFTAMDLHQMTQHPLATVFVATVVQKKTVELDTAQFRFITLTERKFAFGHEPQRIGGGEAIEAADLERTFLDCADRPDLCGGAEAIVQGFARRHDDLQRDRLLRYVLELGQPVTTKRLGYLLEIVGHGDPRLIRELERLAGRIGNYAPLIPGGGEDVERNKRWELDINVDPDRLMRAIAT